MFIVNKFFLLFLYFLYLSLQQEHQKKFCVCENLLGNKSDSNSDSDSDLNMKPDLFYTVCSDDHTHDLTLCVLITCTSTLPTQQE